MALGDVDPADGVAVPSSPAILLGTVRLALVDGIALCAIGLTGVQQIACERPHFPGAQGATSSRLPRLGPHRRSAPAWRSAPRRRGRWCAGRRPSLLTPRCQEPSSILAFDPPDAEIVVAHDARKMAITSNRAAPGLLARLSRAARRLLNDVSLAVAAHRDLQRLARSDDRALRDVGITRLQAERLARRSVWDHLRRRSETASPSTR